MLKLQYFLTVLVIIFQILQVLSLGIFVDLSDFIRSSYSQFTLILLVFTFDYYWPLKNDIQKVLKFIILLLMAFYLGTQFFARPVTLGTHLLGGPPNYIRDLGLTIMIKEQGLTRSLYLLTIYFTSIWLTLNLSTSKFFSFFKRINISEKIFLTTTCILLFIETTLPLDPRSFPSRNLNPLSYQLFYLIQKKPKDGSIEQSKTNHFKVVSKNIKNPVILLYIPGLSQAMLKSDIMKETLTVLKDKGLELQKVISQPHSQALPFPTAIGQELLKLRISSYLFYQGFLDDKKVSQLKTDKGISFIVSSDNPNYSDETILKNILGFFNSYHSHNPIVIGHLKSLTPPFKFGPFINKKGTTIKNFNNLLTSFIKTVTKSHPKVSLGIISDQPQMLFSNEPTFRKYEAVFVAPKGFPFQIAPIEEEQSFHDPFNLRQVWHKMGKPTRYCSTHFSGRKVCASF
jgi:hypothetical protein